MLPCYSCSLRNGVSKSWNLGSKVDDNGGFRFDHMAKELKMKKMKNAV